MADVVEFDGAAGAGGILQKVRGRLGTVTGRGAPPHNGPSFVYGDLEGVTWYRRVLIPRTALEEYKQRTQPDGKPPGPGRPKKKNE